MAPESNLVQADEGGVFQIVVDDSPAESRGAPGLSASAALFLAGLVVSVLILRSGHSFFFLPIILPFGFGGGSAVGRVVQKLWPRVLRVRHTELSFMRLGPLGGTRLGSMDVTRGVFIALHGTGIWNATGSERCVLRFVGAEGALSVPLSSVERARLFRGRLAGFFDEARVRVIDEAGVLKGGVRVRDTPGAREVEWSALSPRARQQSTLRICPESWALRITSGRRVIASTGGSGRLSARLVEHRPRDPAGAGVALPVHALELESEGESVATVGEGLSEPELRYISAVISGPKTR